MSNATLLVASCSRLAHLAPAVHVELRRCEYHVIAASAHQPRAVLATFGTVRGASAGSH